MPCLSSHRSGSFRLSHISVFPVSPPANTEQALTKWSLLSSATIFHHILLYLSWVFLEGRDYVLNTLFLESSTVGLNKYLLAADRINLKLVKLTCPFSTFILSNSAFRLEMEARRKKGDMLAFTDYFAFKS